MPPLSHHHCAFTCRFNDLSALIDPGKDPKTDKLTVLMDAIKFIQQIRIEHNQVRQLNKFLEERCAQIEKDRSQLMFQHMMLQQQQTQQSQVGVALVGVRPSAACDRTALSWVQ